MSRNGSKLFTILRSSSAASKSAPANTRTKFVPSPICQQQRKQELKRQTRHKYAFAEKSIMPHYTMHKKSFFRLLHYPITAIKNIVVQTIPLEHQMPQILSWKPMSLYKEVSHLLFFCKIRVNLNGYDFFSLGVQLSG